MAQDDSADKSFEPTPKKLEDARKKGEVPKSVDLTTAAGYMGFTLCLLSFGPSALQGFASGLVIFLDRPHTISSLNFNNSVGAHLFAETVLGSAVSIFPLFGLPALMVILAILGQRAFVFTPSKLNLKGSRVSIIQNAKQKFGLSGLFEFAKSFAKLVVYSICLGLFLNRYLPEMIVSAQLETAQVLSLLGFLMVRFLALVVLISLVIGAIDAIFQHQEHIRKNRMSRKEMLDEQKESEGDPHMKQERRQRAQAIAAQKMMADVPKADVVIVNPTHYAVALAWSRAPGTAPICVAKGLDNAAFRIREIAHQAGVPVHSDPPTARALHASTDVGEEVAEQFYQSVATAIRFADDMRQKARQRGFA